MAPTRREKPLSSGERVRTDGPVLRGTRRNLEFGVRGKPLPAEAVAAATQQAIELLGKILDTYEVEVARGEVGSGGSGQASDSPPNGAPTGLLYGRVQSGKTAAMVLTAAAALDNGFRVIVIVTANNVALVRQTADRFKAIDGPRILSTVKDGTEYVWEGDEDELRSEIAEDGVLLVCAKDATHLPSVIGLLQQIDAGAYPTLVFDDEADAATPDTTLAARTSGRPSAPSFPSMTYRRVIENTAPGEEGESIREVLPHHVFVGVTATPFVLFLQRFESPIRPSFAYLLEPGTGYCGGERFFAGFDPSKNPQDPPLVIVADNESQLLAARRRVTTGLASSIAFFLLAATALRLRNGGRFPEKGYKHLSHTSPLMTQHDQVADIISGHLRSLRRALRTPGAADTIELFRMADQELRRTVADLPDLLEAVSETIGQAEVFRINAETGVPDFGPRFNFLVGGNILARGLTIDELLVTYYLREAKVSQMDTVWQHARMYGYREDLMPFTRVYLPSRLAANFQRIHESEEALRAVVRAADAGGVVPIRIAARTRPTRPNALEQGVLRVYRGGEQIFPYYAFRDEQMLGRSVTEIRDALRRLAVPLDEARRERRFVEVSTDEVLAIVPKIPVREDDGGRWDTEGVVALLEQLRERYSGRAVLYARPFDPGEDPGRRRRTGVLSGPEVNIVRAQAKPVLALAYAGTPDTPQFWFPSLFIPDDAPPHIFNPE